MAPRDRRATRSSRSTPGLGNDTVHNLAVRRGRGSVELGPGADTYVGNDFPRARVRIALSWPLEGDTDVDVFQTGGGVDVITSGAARGREPRQHLDGRRQRQHLVQRCRGRWPSSTTVRPQTPCTWSSHGRASSSSTTSLAGPVSAAARCSPGRPSTGSRCALFPAATSPSSAPTRTSDLALYGSVRDLAAPAAVSTGGGDDSVRLENYLPSSVDLGEGVRLPHLPGLPPRLRLAGRLRRMPGQRAVSRCPRPSRGSSPSTARRPTASPSRGVTAPIASLPCRSTSWSAAIVAPTTCSPVGHGSRRSTGGRGNDRIKGVGDRGVILNGGRGADVLRGDRGPDQLRGDLGRDVAWGQQGKDECKTEVRHGCE